MYPVTKDSSTEELPVIFRDDDTYHSVKTGIAYGSVTLKFRKKNATSWTTDSITADNWTEVGDGHYTWNPASGDLDTEGPLLYIVQANDCVQYEGAVYVTDNVFDDLATDIAGLNDPTAAAIADAVLDEAMAGHTTGGTFGGYMDSLNTRVDQAISTTESNIRGSDDDDLKDISDEIAGLSIPTAGDNADAVWDESTAGHATGGTFGGAVVNLVIDMAGIKAKTDNLPADTASELDAIDAAIAGLNDPTAGAIADAVLEEAIADHSGVAGSLAELLDSTLDQALSTTESNIRGADSDDLKDLSDEIAAVQADLDNPDQFKADVSGLATTVALAVVGSNVSAIKTKTDNLPADTASELDAIDAAIASLNDIAVTDILSDSTPFAGALIANLSDLDQAISTTESNIRGADSDTLETLSDQIDGISITALDVADAVLDELLSEHTAAGSLSAILQAIYDTTSAEGGYCEFE